MLKSQVLLYSRKKREAEDVDDYSLPNSQLGEALLAEALDGRKVRKGGGGGRQRCQMVTQNGTQFFFFFFFLSCL